MKIDPLDNTLKSELNEVSEVEQIVKSINNYYAEGKLNEANNAISKALAICQDLQFLKIKQVECLSKIGQTEKVQNPNS